MQSELSEAFQASMVPQARFSYQCADTTCVLTSHSRCVLD